jgi:RNA ligase
MPTLAEIINVAALEKQLEEGFIARQTHPTLPLAILNYTPKTTFENHWTPETIKCRGLIYETKTAYKYVIARGFNKFFNVDDPAHPETASRNIKEYETSGHRAYVTEKLDGSMGIIWKYEDSNYNLHYGVATRGSFTSPQAQWATDFLLEHRKHTPFSIPSYYAPIVEIIYPENRIVVQYKYEGLVTIGLVAYTGQEMKYHDMRQWSRKAGFPCVKAYHKTIDEIMAEDKSGSEGYVYTLPAANVKVKVKFLNYVKLHKIITGWSPKDVWEVLKEKSPYDGLFTENIPQHFKDWFNRWKNLLTVEYNLIEQKAKEFYAGMELGRTRKAMAADIEKASDPRIIPVLFKMLDNKPYDDVIWKQIKPKGTDKPINEEV